VEDALDWLCLNLPQAQLPRRFAAAARAGKPGSQVKVVSRAAEQPGGRARAQQASLAADFLPPSESSEGSEEEKEGHEEAQEQEQGAQPAGEGGAADDKEAAKAWILQQYAGEGIGAPPAAPIPHRFASWLAGPQGPRAASAGRDLGPCDAPRPWPAGGDDYASGDDAASSSSSEFDDLELWADPREVARRRQERARAKIPPEQRRCAGRLGLGLGGSGGGSWRWGDAPAGLHWERAATATAS
jgi:hypothetical protein